MTRLAPGTARIGHAGFSPESTVHLGTSIAHRTLVRALASFVLLSVLAIPSVASADVPAVVPPPEPPVATPWYGYEALATDGAAATLLLPALLGKGSGMQIGFGLASAGTYLLGAPVVHAARGHGGKAAGDFAMRLLLPAGVGLFGGFIGMSTYRPAPCTPPTTTGFDLNLCPLGQQLGEAAAFGAGALIGAGIGMASAIAINAAHLLLRQRARCRVLPSKT